MAPASRLGRRASRRYLIALILRRLLRGYLLICLKLGRGFVSWVGRSKCTRRASVSQLKKRITSKKAYRDTMARYATSDRALTGDATVRPRILLLCRLEV